MSSIDKIMYTCRWKFKANLIAMGFNGSLAIACSDCGGVTLFQHLLYSPHDQAQRAGGIKLSTICYLSNFFIRTCNLALLTNFLLTTHTHPKLKISSQAEIFIFSHPLA